MDGTGRTGSSSNDRRQGRHSFLAARRRLRPEYRHGRRIHSKARLYPCKPGEARSCPNADRLAIVFGQGCEFDYSGTQACKALREEGYQVVLVNSNPATIMTDPDVANRTYIEPITPEAVAKVIEKEKDGPFHIDALLPTLGGQTA